MCRRAQRQYAPPLALNGTENLNRAYQVPQYTGRIVATPEKHRPGNEGPVHEARPSTRKPSPQSSHAHEASQCRIKPTRRIVVLVIEPAPNTVRDRSDKREARPLAWKAKRNGSSGAESSAVSHSWRGGRRRHPLRPSQVTCQPKMYLLVLAWAELERGPPEWADEWSAVLKQVG